MYIVYFKIKVVIITISIIDYFVYYVACCQLKPH